MTGKNDEIRQKLKQLKYLQYILNAVRFTSNAKYLIFTRHQTFKHDTNTVTYNICNNNVHII